tara:strand:+ start:195836 stop:196222 length:387 start_codon:yes stop_codon:yes gene_type:complete
MPPVIRLSDELYHRLAAYAEGFDTPANVIERILNEKEGVESVSPTRLPEDLPKPELIFYPDESAFRSAIIRHVPARAILHYRDGSSEERLWNTDKFSANSNLRGNIWSGFLRGWKQAGITKAEFHLDE